MGSIVERPNYLLIEAPVLMGQRLLYPHPLWWVKISIRGQSLPRVKEDEVIRKWGIWEFGRTVTELLQKLEAVRCLVQVDYTELPVPVNPHPNVLLSGTQVLDLVPLGQLPLDPGNQGG
jgi:hypothetical protein